MSVNMYLLYDGVLKYAMEDDLSQFKKLESSEVCGCDIGTVINWIVSSHDTQLKKIQVKDLKKIAGKSPVKGNWKDTWTEKPKSISNTHCQGTPDASGATVDNPMVFAFDITYQTKGSGENRDLKLVEGVGGDGGTESGAWFPNPPKDPPY